MKERIFSRINEWMEQILSVCKDRKKRNMAVFISLTALSFCCFLLLAWALFSWEKPISFGKLIPAASKTIRSQDISSSLPGISGETEGKLSYERLKGGDVMYCSCFGLLNIRTEPSKESAAVGRIAYGDEVRVFWKEDSGYVRVLYKKTNSEEYLEGYCLREELSEENPEDGRVFLNLPDFKQYDERWGGKRLGNSYETIKTAGCTTTCLAMAYSYLEGHVTTPAEMEERLGYNEDGMLGFPKVYERTDADNYLEIALTKLREGIPVLIGCLKDADHPHWVLIMGYAGDGAELNPSDFLIHDPASEERPTLQEFFADYPIYNKIAYYNGAGV